MRIRYFTRLLLAVTGIGVGLSVFSAENAAPTPPAPPPPEVKTETVTSGDFPLILEYPARTVGYKEVEVRAQVSGIMLKRTFQEGSYVEKGQLLFRIDPRIYEANLKNAEGTLAQQKALLRQHERDYKRIQAVTAKGFASESTLDTAISNYEQSIADIQTSEGEVNARRIDLEYTEVTAPVSGMTSRETTSEGSLMISGNPQYSLLTKITQLDPIYVNFAYPDHEGLWLRDSVLSGNILLPPGRLLKATILLSNNTTYPLNGTVDFTDSFIDLNTGSVNARATVANPDRRLLPGQFVKVKIEGLIKPNAITIPQRAVSQTPDGLIVYVVNAKGLAEKRIVTTGLTTGDRWLIESGLKIGDQVIIDGLIHVRDGQPVTIKNNSSS